MTRNTSHLDPLAGITMDRVRTFRAVAEYGGIAAAVRALQRRGLRDSGAPAHAQSQFSRQIAALEAALGAKLFGREGKGFRLTEAGRSLAEASAGWLEALEAIRARNPGDPIELTLTAGDSLLAWVVVPNLAAFLAGAAHVRLALRASATPVEDVESGRAHLAIGPMARQVPAACRRTALGERRYALFVPRRRATRALGLRELLLSGPLARVASAPGPHEAACRHARVTPPISLTCETFAQAARAVAAQTHAAVLPAEAAAELGPEIAHLEPLPMGGERLYLVARRRTLALAGGDEIFSHLRAALGNALSDSRPARSANARQPRSR